MDIFINFTNPLLISKGIDKDLVICKIINRKLFVSSISYEELQSDRIYIQKSIPRQLPAGIIEADIKADAASASNGMKAMMFV